MKCDALLSGQWLDPGKDVLRWTSLINDSDHHLQQEEVAVLFRLVVLLVMSNLKEWLFEVQREGEREYA